MNATFLPDLKPPTFGCPFYVYLCVLTRCKDSSIFAFKVQREAERHCNFNATLLLLFIYNEMKFSLGFPRDYYAGDVGLIPGSGRSPGGGNGNTLQYSCLGNPMDRGPWLATVRGATKESDMTECLNNKIKFSLG